MDRTELTQEIIALQEKMSQAMTRHTPDAWMNLSLTLSQLRVLFFVDFEGSTNFERLSASLGSTRRNISAIVDALIEQGLVKRDKHPDDRRLVILKLTKKGESLIASLRKSQMTRMTGMLAKMSLKELSAMCEHLTVLAKTFGVPPQK